MALVEGSRAAGEGDTADAATAVGCCCRREIVLGPADDGRAVVRARHRLPHACILWTKSNGNKERGYRMYAARRRVGGDELYHS